MHARWNDRRGIALLVLMTLAVSLGHGVVRVSGALGAESTAVRSHVFSVKDSPGYVPLVDPESSSVALGRRLHAPLVRETFTGGATSMRGLVQRILHHLHRNQDDSLQALCVDDFEFRRILWREFPQSRPATGLQWVDAWKILGARLHAGCVHAVRDHGGHVYTLVSVKADTVQQFRNFRLHRGMHIVVRSDEGQTLDMVWLRTVAERRGRFKIYSTED